MEVVLCLSVVFYIALQGLRWLDTLLVVGLVFVYARGYYDRSENNGARRWPWFFAKVAALSQAVAARYFTYTVEYYDKAAFEQLRHSDRRVVFAASPHGLFALASYFNVITLDPLWQRVQPFVHRHVFAVPLAREITLWLGAIDPTPENITDTLRLRGQSVYVVIDGSRGMLQQRTDNRGLLRLAYAERALLCPVMHSGQDQVFTCYSRPELDRLRSVCCDLVGYPFPTFWRLHCQPLKTRVLRPLDPTAFATEEQFIEAYSEALRRGLGNDAI